MSGTNGTIEMQVSNTGDLKQRLVYYACKLYADQLQSGYDYDVSVHYC